MAKAMSMAEMWANIGTLIATITIFYSMFQQYCPQSFRCAVQKYTHKLTTIAYPYVQITFQEYPGNRFKRSEAYATILTYLSENSAQRVRRLKAEVVADSQTPVVLSMDDNEEVTDEFHGVKLWWAAKQTASKPQMFPFYPSSEEKRSLTLTFHKRYRDLVNGPYLTHVLEEGKAIAKKNRRLKLFTNNPSSGGGGYKSSPWNHIVFEHPATFKTLAMEEKKKEEIVKDLVKFKSGKEYYWKIGKAWKRGYLLYGPPGTGKSSMIAAIANFMHYDIYDLELTAIKDNTELRKLLIETSNKSIVVIEDIDCSLDLTGQRKKKKKEKNEEESEGKDPISKKAEEEENKSSKVTLSGLLNSIDGLWSACGAERIIVFTTNFVDKLDPALIRRGRMDKHIELSYCCYEAFKVLAMNYLDIEEHFLFGRIEKLLGEVDMTPADVAENLMPKSEDEDVDSCLQNLISALENAKEEAKKKAEEEEKKKRAEEEEERLKAEKEKEENDKEEVKIIRKSGEEVKENGFLR